MNSYTRSNPPRSSGTARKIWNSLTGVQVALDELHYNPNCWGASTAGGWGTWACTAYIPTIGWRELFCGWSKSAGEAYVVTMGGEIEMLRASDIQRLRVEYEQRKEASMSKRTEGQKADNVDVTECSSVGSCARCGNDHDAVRWVKFKEPVELGQFTATHWGTCPETGDPILAWWAEEGDEQPAPHS